MKKLGRAIAVALFSACVSCGGAKVSPQSPTGWTADQIDADPMALLPPNAVAACNVDAHAFFTSGAIGSQASILAEQILPVADAAGFNPSRDVDRVVVGVYAAEGADVAAILEGRFDVDKIAKAAEEEKLARAGGVVATTDYAGRKIYTVKNVGFCVLTSKTVVAGTEVAIRRVLDRITDGNASPRREVTPWMIDTLQTPNAAAALAADFGTQPIVITSVGALQIPWLKTMKTARVLADFKSPGMHVAGTLSFADAAGATRAADGMRGIARLASIAAAFGAVPKLQSLAITTAQSDVECSFAVDEAALRKVLAFAPQLVH